jgi:glycosyltransferase involved in cell wall biosynthesis
MLSTAVAAPAPVLFVSFSGAYGGAERILVDCAARLGEPAVVACPPGPLATAARDAGLRVSPLRPRSIVLRSGARAALSHAAGLVGLARDVTRITADERAPTVVAWGMRAVLAASPPRLGVPVLAVHNDLLPKGPVATAVRAATKRCAGAVALSHAIAEELPPGAAVLHPGVALGEAPAAPPPGGRPRVLWLGALVPWKRPGLALDVAERVPEAAFDLGGSPLPDGGQELVTELRRRVAGPQLAGRARLLGQIPDAAQELAGAHVLLHTADAEPFGMVLVEALAAGRPVVAPAAAGPLEIVGAGGAGRLFPPGDADAAAAALRAVLADAGAPAAAWARAAAFDVEESAARFAASLAEVRRR